MRKLGFLAAALVALPVSANAATIVNGSFESGTAPGSFLTVGAGDSTTITGWTVGGNSVDYIGSYFPAQSGSRSVDLSGNAPGSLTQTIATIIGQSYLVTFYLGANYDGAPASKTVDVASGGAATTFTYTGTGPGFSGYAPYSYGFTATSTATPLSFTSTSGTAYGAVIDNVSISSVPEAATWAMMIGGFGLAGTALRRRKAVPAFA